jgi:chlorobactene glucosyltransferase
MSTVPHYIGLAKTSKVRYINGKMLALFVFSYLSEVLPYIFQPLWWLRKYWVFVTTSLVLLASIQIIRSDTSFITIMIGIISVYRIFNQARIFTGRMHEQYLRVATARTVAILGAGQLLLVMINVLFPTINYWRLLEITSWLQLAIAVVVLIITIRNLRKTRHLPHIEYYADKELPTLSVLIPARNETADLEDCLRSVLASDYPKLEVLVLDDCSYDKTSTVVRAFAQDGVRFIKGKEPDEHWLAKNHAYERLRQEASGELLLFCGVDVRFGPHSIRALVTTLMNRQKDMVSVMPRRLRSTAMASLIQPMRYWWELALPRRLFNRPPVLSTCWVAKSELIESLGGFSAVSRSITPEAYFARELVKRYDSYSFVRSDDVLSIETVKNLADQRQTAIRVRYPQLRRRPEFVLLLSALEVAFLLGPFLYLVLNLPFGFDGHLLASVIASFSLVITHVLIVTVSNPANVPIALLNFPVVVITELVLLYESMIRYEFGRVSWKDRNICIPVMHVVPRLPDLKL